MNKYKDIPRNMTGGVALSMCAFIVISLFFIEVPEANQRLADVAFGVVLGWGSLVMTFHFASSLGSKAKTEQINTLMDREKQE